MQKIDYNIFTIISIDELRILEEIIKDGKDLTKIHKVLSIIKGEVDPNVLYVLTALDPSVFKVNGLEITRSNSLRFLDWKIIPRMPVQNMINLVSMLPQTKIDHQKVNNILLTALQLTDGHYRSIETVNICTFYIIV